MTISAINLVRKYGPVRAVDGVSFDAVPGEITGFVGPNGAGKTTLLRLLSGCIAPTSGRALVNGADIEETPESCKQSTGYLPENNPLYPDMETAETLLWAGEMRGLCGSELRQAVRDAVDKCSLGPALGTEVGRLSRGFRQRIGIACALLHDPQTLLLDEPTGGLDPNQAHDIMRLIRELGETKTVLLSTHMLSEARAACGRLIVMDKGKIAAQGTPEELAERTAAGQKVLVTIERIPDPEDARVRFYEIDGVTQCELVEEWPNLSYEITAEGSAEIRKTVFETAVVNGWKVLELTKERTPLNEIFRSLTS